MGGLMPRLGVSVVCLFALTACPMKDWLKRDESYLTVEQYKTMTEVVTINDTLYRVRRGEEINQNQISQLFVNVNEYVSTPRKERSKALKTVQKAYNSDRSLFNTLNYVLVLLQDSGQEKEAFRVLARFNNTGMKSEDKDLVNLAQVLYAVLINNANARRVITKLTAQQEKTSQEVVNLKSQINALKSIEDSIHARE